MTVRITIAAALVAIVGFVCRLDSVAAGSSALTIYFIDVEGGQSTLIVTPAGQALLVDAGFAGAGTMQSKAGDPQHARDAQRILSATRDAGLKAIDYLLITHFHPDHVGGVPELVQLLPVHTFIDHEKITPGVDERIPGSTAAYQAYMTVRAKGRHLNPKVGERLPIKGVDVTVVSSAASTISKPLQSGAANPACPASAPPAADNENPSSTGFQLKFGKFRFMDLGDLSGEPLFKLFCPRDLLGPVGLYLIAHHGGADVSNPAFLGAVRPRVAILNNGVGKGGARQMFASLHDAEGIEDVWQLHRTRNQGAENFSDDRIANLDESTSHWIKVVANEDGSFVVTNGRTNSSKKYDAPGKANGRS